MILVIAEKPSVANSIATVIGATNKNNGYYEGNGYIVSHCVGHLIGLANPDKYDEKYKKWNLADLPIIPKEYKYEINKATKKQFDILKSLLNNKSVGTVINACDAGREGESIFRLVYGMVGCKKKIKRLWISSMEDAAIKEGFENLKDGKDYENLFKAAEARAKADWLIGMNISRLYTLKKGEFGKSAYSVGRVQTPTLAMIVYRDNKIVNFQKEKYYKVEIILNSFKMQSDKIDSIEEANKILDKIGSSITIAEIEKKEKITKPPLPYDLNTLQREANHIYGYSAARTLELAQSLYEKKMLTYPRTDSRYLTEDMLVNIVNNIIGKNDFDTKRIGVIFNSKKVTDHHAIIPTISSMSASKDNLEADELSIYELCLNKLYASFSYPLIEEITKIKATVSDTVFTAKGKVIKDEGFTKFVITKRIKDEKEENAEEQNLPNVKEGDEFSVLEKSIKEEWTKPPQHFNEDTLLKAMEIAGSDCLQKGIEIERKGIGTPATRAGIIENLISKDYIRRDKKNLLATDKGKELIEIVSEEFKSPKTTADFEMELADIGAGKSKDSEFLKKIENLIKEEILKER